MHNYSHENEFNLHVNKISFSYESMGTKTHLGKGADLNVDEKVNVIHCGRCNNKV